MSIQIPLPPLSEGVEEAEVIQIKVVPGDRVHAGQDILEVETDKATVAVPCPLEGTIAEILVHEGEKIQVGQILLMLDDVASAIGELEASDSDAPPAVIMDSPRLKPSEAGGDEVSASPAARRLARELGVDLQEIGKQITAGRITEEDVRRHAPTAVLERAVLPDRRPLPDFSKWGPIRRTHLSPLRRKIGENVSYAWSHIPHVHQFHEADITDLETFRKRQAEVFAKRGVHLTFTIFLLKALVHTLKKFPQFNTSLDMASGEVIFKDYYHIGVAVDTEAGLIVPVLRDVDQKGFSEIAQELSSLAQRTRDRQVTPEELSGGTISVSNLGGIGGSFFTPIIRHPEAAVLGVGRAQERVIVRNGQMVPRRFLPLCVAYDHRIIDGADGARFISHLVGLLENFEEILVEG
jgi:pyruvate dehydrogenase E2 component (dihydrolipoamide acetyltransferase)